MQECPALCCSIKILNFTVSSFHPSHCDCLTVPRERKRREKSRVNEANSPVDRVFVAFVDIGYRRRSSRGCRRENVLGWLRRRRWVLGMCRPHTADVWTVMESRYTPGTSVWIVQSCSTTATSALEVTPVQPAIVILKPPESEKKEISVNYRSRPMCTFVRSRVCVINARPVLLDSRARCSTRAEETCTGIDLKEIRHCSAETRARPSTSTRCVVRKG